ncbi:MAG: XisH family protein [Xenococcaceae cyanobacterium]
MPAKDIYHDCVKNALIKGGWNITHDPFKLEIGKKDLYIDLGATQLIAATKAERKIAVKIKSFIGRSDVDDLEKALGQYVLYFDILEDFESERILYLAIRLTTFEDLFEEPIGKIILKKRRVKLIVFEPNKEEILKWIP